MQLEPETNQCRRKEVISLKVELKQQHHDIRVNLKNMAIDPLNRPDIF